MAALPKDDEKIISKSVDTNYFSSYEDLEVHRLMISDYSRTRAYEEAILGNSNLFKNKIVMDIGAGSGILSLFAAKAGARIVHAIEASNMANVITDIAKDNGFESIIQAHHCRVENLTHANLIEKDNKFGKENTNKDENKNDKNDKNENEYKVDIIISEWMGFYLFHESMLSSVLDARDKFLNKENGCVFPRICKLYACPTDLSLFYNKYIYYWNDLYGFKFNSIKNIAKNLRQTRPEIDIINEYQLLSDKRCIISLDLLKMHINQIKSISKQIFFIVKENEMAQAYVYGVGGDGAEEQTLDGLALWFDVIFTNESNPRITDSQHAINSIQFGNLYNSNSNDNKSKNDESDVKMCNDQFKEILLSTGPDCEPTHWKQTLIFLPQRVKIDKNNVQNNVYGFNINLIPDKTNGRLYNISIDMLPHDCLQCKIIRHTLKNQQQPTTTTTA